MYVLAKGFNEFSLMSQVGLFVMFFSPKSWLVTLLNEDVKILPDRPIHNISTVTFVTLNKVKLTLQNATSSILSTDT